MFKLAQPLFVNIIVSIFVWTPSYIKSYFLFENSHYHMLLLIIMNQIMLHYIVIVDLVDYVVLYIGCCWGVCCRWCFSGGVFGGCCLSNICCWGVLLSSSLSSLLVCWLGCVCFGFGGCGVCLWFLIVLISKKLCLASFLFIFII